MERIITGKDLADILGIAYETVKVYMDGYRFTKYAVKIQKREKRNGICTGYKFNQYFINELKDFFEITNKKKQLKNLDKYLKDFNFCL